MRLADYQKLSKLIPELQKTGKEIEDSGLQFSDKQALILPISEALHKIETALSYGREAAEKELNHNKKIKTIWQILKRE